MFESLQLTKKKKKKRKNTSQLLTGFENLDEADVIASLHEIKKKLREIFRNHIGVNNSIHPTDLFELVYGVNPENLNTIKKEYWWNILKKILRGLRYEETLFVIIRGSKLFVLQTKKEAEDYKIEKDRHIENLEELKKKATRWVTEEKWRRI